MDAYENYCLEGILRKWSQIKKEKGITFSNEIENVFTFFKWRIVLFIVFLLLTVITAIVSLFCISQLFFCFFQISLLSALFFLATICYHEVSNDYINKSRYQSCIPCIKLLLNIYPNQEMLMSFLDRKASIFRAKLNGILDKFFTIYMSTIVTLIISIIVDKFDIIFSIDIQLNSNLLIIVALVLIFIYHFLRFLILQFYLNYVSPLKKIADLIDLLDVYGLSIQQNRG